MVLITLFGEDSYAAPLGDPPPNGGIAWVLHTRERKWERLSADAFIARIVAAGDPPPFDPMARDYPLSGFLSLSSRCACRDRFGD